MCAGPRLGRFDANGKPREMPGHNNVFYVSGVSISDTHSSDLDLESKDSPVAFIMISAPEKQNGKKLIFVSRSAGHSAVVW